MTFDPYTNRIQFGMLTDEEKKILLTEGSLEICAKDGSWVPADGRAFFDKLVYRRTRPAP